MKNKILKILKQFEQRDYKRGGTSIAPEMYNAICDKIYKDLIEPQINFNKKIKKELFNCTVKLQDKKDIGY